MKKALLIFLAIIVLLFTALATLPYFFKDEILAAVKKEINKNINAKFELEDVRLSVFQHFPDITMGLQNVSISNYAPFEGDTLAKFDDLALTVSLSDLISNKHIVITNLELQNPSFNVLVDAQGNANYDIAKSDDTAKDEPEEEEETTGESDLTFALEHYGIYNANVVYTDVQGLILAQVNGLTHEGTADFTLNKFDVNSSTSIEGLTVEMEGVKYLNKSTLNLNAILGIDLDKMLFTLKENELKVNELALAFDGSIAMPNDDIGFDMSFSAKDNQFKSLISLIPAVFLEGFEALKVDGTFALNGKLGGIYSETSMPTVQAAVKINGGKVQYPDLPSALEKISADINFTSNGAVDFDDAVLNVSEFHMELANSPVNANLLLKTPISDPDITSEVYAKVDFAKLKSAIPLEGMNMAGLLDLNLKLKTRLSTIEKEEFEKVQAEGEMKLNNFNLTGDSVPYPISFSEMSAQLSPQYLGFKVNNFKTTGIVANADGFFSNLLSFALHDGTLKGEFNAIAEEINVDPYFEEEEGETAESNENNAEVKPSVTANTLPEADPLDFMRLPSNIYLDFNLTSKNLLYDGANFKNISATGFIENGVVNLSEAKTSLFGAPVLASGNFNTLSPQPSFALNAAVDNLDIQNAVKTFESINKYFPIAKATSGMVNTTFSMGGNIGDDLFPIYKTLNGAGVINTDDISIENFAAFNKVAEKLKFDVFKKQNLDDAKISFEISNGSLFIKPFSTKIGAMDAKFVGRTGLDETIDYTVNLDIPTKMFPNEAMGVVNGLASKASSLLGKQVSIGDKINIDLLFTNTISDVKVETKFNGSSGKSAVDDAKAKLKEELDKKKAEAEAKAKEAIDKAKAEAEAKAKAAANEAKAKAEAEKKRLEEEARKKLEEEKRKAEEEAKKKIKGLFGGNPK